MIHEEICTYEVCKLAKEKGFNVPTRTVKVEKIEGTEKEVWDEEEYRYITQWETRSLRMPTQALLQRWLREEKGIDIEITVAVAFNQLNGFYRQYDCQIKSPRKGEPIFVAGGLLSYEDALEDALKYALENLV